LIKLLPYILFEKYVYILALKMATWPDPATTSTVPIVSAHFRSLLGVCTSLCKLNMFYKLSAGVFYVYASLYGRGVLSRRLLLIPSLEVTPITVAQRTPDWLFYYITLEFRSAFRHGRLVQCRTVLMHISFFDVFPANDYSLLTTNILSGVRTYAHWTNAHTTK